MDEGNPPSGGSRARGFIYQAVAPSTAGIERLVEIGHSVADVMNTGTSLREEFGDRTVRRSWGKQLYLGLAERQRYDGGSVGDFRSSRQDSKYVPIECERRFQIRHGDSDMGNAGAIRH
jgi:hypothetical protein